MYSRGAIVLVPFPFSNQSDTKKRPAIVISSNAYNTASSDLVIMAVTSHKEKISGLDECAIENWKEAGLLKPSYIKTAISTVERKLILKKLGSLSKKDIFSADNLLKQFLGL